jgi:GH25 family lysozyme M1 (1,4-beta-N-acetylmuramidase)
VWYADYEELPQTPYAFEFWQYSESAHVDGIPEAVDTDIWLTR